MDVGHGPVLSEAGDVFKSRAAPADAPHPPSATVTITNLPRRLNRRLVWKARTVSVTPGCRRGPWQVPGHYEAFPNTLVKVLGPYPSLEREPLFKSERPS